MGFVKWRCGDVLSTVFEGTCCILRAGWMDLAQSHGPNTAIEEEPITVGFDTLRSQELFLLANIW